MKPARRTIWAGMAALLAGCAVGPDYKKPDVAMPAAWQGDIPFKAAQPNDDALKGNWWELYQDAKLNELEQQAIAQNQSLKQAASRLEQAHQIVTVASSPLFPQAGASAGASRAEVPPRPLQAKTGYGLGFEVSYEADLFGSIRRGVEAARAGDQQAGADFENTRLLLTTQLAADYFNLRELDAEIDVVRQGIALEEKALQFVSSRHDLGLASGLDLAQQQALLDSTKTQLELLQNQRAQNEHALAVMTGTPAPLFHIEAAQASLAPPALPVGVPSDVLQRRPDVAAAERAMAQANANIGVAKAAYFPSLTIQPLPQDPSVGWSSNQFHSLISAPNLIWSLGASLTQTLFDAGKTTANVRIAEQSYQGAVAAYRQSVLVAMQEVEDGITGATLLQRASNQSEAAVRSSQKAFDLANDRYTGGLDTYLDVITAQQTLLTNQRQATQIHGQQMLTSVYLVKALGGGWQGLESDKVAAN
ncbi:MAG TPA: efflux transporter outer membrane subunit [Burkholderiaceae bacterium]